MSELKLQSGAMPLATPRPRVRLEFDPHNPRRLIVYTPVGVWSPLREAPLIALHPPNRI